MFSWLADHYVTVIALAAVLLLIILAFVSLIREKKKAGTSCGSGCAGCPYCGSCMKQKAASEKPQ